MDYLCYVSHRDCNAHCLMCDWANLFVWDYVFGFLKYQCGCGGGDVAVGLVCWKWRRVRVIRPVLRLCRDCIGYLDGILSGINWGSVRKIVFCDGKEGMLNDVVFEKLGRLGNLEEIVFGEMEDRCWSGDGSIINSLVRFKKLRVLDFGVFNYGGDDGDDDGDDGDDGDDDNVVTILW